MLAIYNHSIIGIFITCFFLVVIATIQNESHAFSKLPAPRRIHLSQFPELLARSFLQRNLRLSDLYDHQRKAVKKGLFLGKNLVVRTDTDTGKTDIAFIYEFRRLLRGLVGVYLVPHKRLLVDKRWQLENFFTASSGSAPPQELAHVITISGESKPSEKELQKHSK
ncbi:MAG: hypothetical protein HWN65_22100, partial [Candidatus Helarchaeota archaeon]|nr:hypothetical protein [Candidatus Helarchaeota archaeon]